MMSNPETAKTIVDVREMPPRDRHPLIFGSFDQLSPGEALMLVNDHDPKPLFYQFQAESPGKFTWDYLESGPDVWRVRIGKIQEISADSTDSAGCACACTH